MEKEEKKVFSIMKAVHFLLVYIAMLTSAADTTCCRAGCDLERCLRPQCAESKRKFLKYCLSLTHISRKIGGIKLVEIYQL